MPNVVAEMPISTCFQKVERESMRRNTLLFNEFSSQLGPFVSMRDELWRIASRVPRVSSKPDFSLTQIEIAHRVQLFNNLWLFRCETLSWGHLRDPSRY